MEYIGDEPVEFFQGCRSIGKTRCFTFVLFANNIAFAKNVYDVGFRFDAYRYVEVSCFYRVEPKDRVGIICVGDDGILTLAQKKMPSCYSLGRNNKLSITECVNPEQEFLERMFLIPLE